MSLDAATEDAYFSSNPPPRSLAQHTALAESFIAAHAGIASRRVVLITSGGTTVPLEKQTVRFIDNFSAGTRGATSAEYFLEAGYAVIFLHRQFSLLPYSRHFSHSTDCFLDFLDEFEGGRVGWRRSSSSSGANDETGLGTSSDNRADGAGAGAGAGAERGDAKVRTVLAKYRRAKDANTLLMIPFVTIGDYLHELRAISRLMRPLGTRGLLYLAAAVSDFFVPPERMAEHKIQSTDVMTSNSGTSSTGPLPPPAAAAAAADEEPFDNFDAIVPRGGVPRSKRLVIDLDPVPKFLKNLVDGWAPQGMIVSYKLETDPAILVRKARFSLERYQHHLVIGNLLATRKWEVVFVSPGREDMWLRVPPPSSWQPQQLRAASSNGGESAPPPPHDNNNNASNGRSGWGDAEGRPLRAEELPKDDPDTEIEKLIIPAVAELHNAHIKGGETIR